jgi:hypothetical protein
MGRVVLAVGAAVWLTTALASAQTSTATETKQFEVIAVDGNNVVVKLAEGTRELTVPEDFRFTVGGRQVSVHELKAGMTGTATITTRTTMVPVTATEVRNGTVVQVAASTIVVRTDEGLRSFTQSDVDKRGVKIVRDGKPAQVSDFRAGDRLTATIITTLPPASVTEQEVAATLAERAPDVVPAAVEIPSPPSPAPVATSGSAPAQAQTPARQLPKTAGPLPLIALAGLTSLAIAALARRRRQRLK